MDMTLDKQKWNVATGLGDTKRKKPRAVVNGYVGDLADGSVVLNGTIDDVSSGGFKMSNLPDSFSDADRSYMTVISGHGKHFKVLVRPCWSKKVGSRLSLEVGFRIVETSWEWEEMVLNTVSDNCYDDDFSFQS